jgi:Chaperone of endosialidase
MNFPVDYFTGNGTSTTFNLSQYGITIQNISASNTNFIAFLNSSGAQAGSITQTGATSVNYGSGSDYRLKENVQPMSNALAKVNQLNPVTFDWIADKTNGQGFIAHELQAIVPDCVVGEKDSVDAEGKPKYQMVDQSKLVGILTKAIQELSAQVTTLQSQVAALQARVGA